MEPVLPGKKSGGDAGSVDVKLHPGLLKKAGEPGIKDEGEGKGRMSFDTSNVKPSAEATSGRSDTGEGLKTKMRVHHTGNPHRRSDVSMHSILLVRWIPGLVGRVGISRLMSFGCSCHAQVWCGFGCSALCSALLCSFLERAISCCYKWTCANSRQLSALPPPVRTRRYLEPLCTWTERERERRESLAFTTLLDRVQTHRPRPPTPTPTATFSRRRCAKRSCTFGTRARTIERTTTMLVGQRRGLRSTGTTCRREGEWCVFLCMIGERDESQLNNFRPDPSIAH